MAEKSTQAENKRLRALLVEIEKEINRALESDAPAEVLEALLLKIQVVNTTTK
jgi:hypothetical protein